MHLPLHMRAAAMAVAVSTTASIIVTITEMAHPPLDGRGVIESLLTPAPARPALALVTYETRRDVTALEEPQP